jgi:serine/threonine protein kinase
LKTYQVGDRIAGEFVVEAVLGGAGLSGMGSVYKVRHRDLEDTLVIKTIQAEQHSHDLLARFRREAMLWVELGSHPNIVRAIDVRELDWQLAIVAEYVEPDAVGRNTVGQYIRSGAGGHHKALRWAQQFGFAIQHAAGRGLHAHRDIKPDNLMVDTEGNLKGTDFGLARPVLREPGSPTSSSEAVSPAGRLTMVGSVLGTPVYMAPEQFLSSDQVDVRSDLYAFGIVLYEVLSGGQFPYRRSGDTMESLVRAHMTAEPEPLDTPMWPVVERCLQKQPAHRFQSIEAFLESVAGVARQLGRQPLHRPEVDQAALADELYAKAQALVGLDRPRDALQVIEDYLERWPV